MVSFSVKCRSQPLQKVYRSVSTFTSIHVYLTLYQDLLQTFLQYFLMIASFWVVPDEFNSQKVGDFFFQQSSGLQMQAKSYPGTY